MFRSTDHHQGAHVVPCWSYVKMLKWSVKHFVNSTGDVAAYRVSYARCFLCREVQKLVIVGVKECLVCLQAQRGLVSLTCCSDIDKESHMLKFTLKHLKSCYMFRSINHHQGAYAVPCWSYILNWSVKHFVISTGDVLAYRVFYARCFLCREVETMYIKYTICYHITGRNCVSSLMMIYWSKHVGGFKCFNVNFRINNI
jgi:hypothetical protein